MKRLESYQQYQDLFKDRRFTFSNSTLLPGQIRDLIQQQKLYYVSQEDWLLILADQDLFYKAYCHYNEGVLQLDNLDKPVLVEQLDSHDRHQKDLDQMNEILKQAGFVFHKRSLQYQLDITDRNEPLPVIEKGLDFGYCENDEQLAQVRKLWQENLDYLDFVRQYDGLEEKIQIITNENGEVICCLQTLLGKNRSQAGHLVTRKDYTSRGLGGAMMRKWVAEAESRGIRKLVIWIADNNFASMKLNGRLGFVPDGKTSEQYVLFKEERHG